MALSRDAQELTEKRIRRAMLACCCRNPFLRGVYDETKAKYEIKICTPEEFIQLEKEESSKFPVFVDAKFKTKEDAWAEYVKRSEGQFWKSLFTWELSVHLFDAKNEPDVSCAIFAAFNHGVADGLGTILTLKEFLIALNKVDGDALPDYYCLGESMPIPKTLRETFPKLVYEDRPAETEKEELFAKAVAVIKEYERKCNRVVEARHFSRETTNKFIAHCKAHGVTVGAAFTAIYRKAVCADILNVLLPVNVRDEKTEEEVAPRYLSVMFRADFTGTDDIWETARIAGRNIKSASTSEDRWHDGVYRIIRSYLDPVPAPVSHMRSSVHENEASVCISNIGMIERRLYDSKLMTKWFPVDVVMDVINQVGDGVAIWPLTLNGKLSFSILSSSYHRSREIVKKCADDIVEIIENEM